MLHLHGYPYILHDNFTVALQRAVAYSGFYEGEVGRGEASAEGAVGVSPPTGEGSGQGAVPFPDFFCFWFKMGHFCLNFCIQAKGGGSPSEPPP